MKKDQEQIDELIAKYLAGEASVEESAFVEAWKKEDPANHHYV